MKNKKFTYFLGFLVLIVWGGIIYRVFDSLNGPDDFNFQPVQKKTNKESYNDYEINPDTTHLLLNYKDPFAIQKQNEVDDIIIEKNASTKISVPSKPINWNFIKYSGYINNQGSKKLVAIMTINGKSVMLLEGETEEQVKLIKNLQDSIKITFNGNTTFIKRTGAL